MEEDSLKFITNSQNDQNQSSSDSLPVFFNFGMFPPELVRLGPCIVARIVLDQRDRVLRCGLKTVFVRQRPHDYESRTLLNRLFSRPLVEKIITQILER